MVCFHSLPLPLFLLVLFSAFSPLHHYTHSSSLRRDTEKLQVTLWTEVFSLLAYYSATVFYFGLWPWDNRTFLCLETWIFVRFFHILGFIERKKTLVRLLLSLHSVVSFYV